MGNVLEHEARAAGEGRHVPFEDADVLEDDLKWLAVRDGFSHSIFRTRTCMNCYKYGSRPRIRHYRIV